jgi:transglutaminase-like putative cysteine protease
VSRRWPSVAQMVQLVAVAIIGALPGIIMRNLVDGDQTIRVAAASAVAAVAVVVAVRALTFGASGVVRVASLTASVAAAALGLAVAVSAAWPANGGSAWRGAVEGLTNGWSAVVSSPVPALAEPRMLVPVGVAVALATGLAAAVALGDRPPIAALAPGALTFLMASIAAGEQPYSPVAVGVGFVVAGAVIALGDQLGSAAAGRQFSAVPALVVVAAVVAGITVGPRLTFGREDQAFDPRDHLLPPTVPSQATNPLALVDIRRKSGDQVMFSYESPEPTRTRLVALDVFDGAQWSTTSPYERAGARIEQPLRTSVESRPFITEITVDGLDGPWLPSIGDPLSVRGVTVLVDPTSGSLIDADGAAQATTYRLESTVSLPDAERLQTLPQASTTEALAATQLATGIPPILQELADKATSDASSPFLRAALLQFYLRGTYTLDEDAIAGHSYGHLSKMLTQDLAGSEEQFATAFAVLGRAVGLPTRVVVGFDDGVDGGDGTFVVRGRDVRVWPEVMFEEVGWVEFNPVPPKPDSSESPEQSEAGGGGIVLQQGVEQPTPVGASPVLGPVGGGGGSGDDGSATVALVVAAVIAGLAMLSVVAGAVVVLVKRRRTARRRASENARGQVLGAWHDVLERLIEAGVAEPGRMTVEELVKYSEPMTSSLAGLYRPVSRALYAEAEITESDSEQAWRSRDRFVHSLARNASRRCRLRRQVDPRPLFRSPVHTSPEGST